MSEVDNEKDIARQMVVSVQQQQRFQKINSYMQTLEDKIKQTIIFISQVQKINKEAEVYSKVGRLFIKAQKKQVVEGLNKRIAMSWKQLICLQKDKISLEESAYSMEPVECLSRAVVMVMHSHPHLSEKKVWVTFDIFTDPRLQEGPPSVWGCGFSGGGQGHKGVGHNRGQGDG